MNLFHFIIVLCCVCGVYAQITKDDDVLWVVKKIETVSLLSFPNVDKNRIDINATLEAMNKPGDVVQNVFQFLQENTDNKAALQSINLGSNQIEHDYEIDSALKQLENLKNTLITLKNNRATSSQPKTIVPTKLETNGNIESKQDKVSSGPTKVSGNTGNKPPVQEIPNCECVSKNRCAAAFIVVIESSNDFENCDVGDVCCTSPTPNAPITSPNSDPDAFSTSVYSNCGILPSMKPGVPPAYSDIITLTLLPWAGKIRGDGISPFSATLIHPRAAITLASKAFSLQSKIFLIEFGSRMQKPRRRVTKIVLHPQYKSTGPFLENDIAILLWDLEIKIEPFVVPVCIPLPNYNFSDKECPLADYDGLARDVEYFDALIKSRSQCSNNKALCVELLQLQKCPLSGGGPMSCELPSERRVVAGLTAWDGKCTKSETFVNVAYYSVWIKENLSNNGLSNK